MYKDQLNRVVNITKTPQKVISLVPSQTELLIDWDINVIGRTKFCIHPKEKIKDITVIGGTKKFRFEVIDKLKPDLIIANKEENYKEGIEILEKKYPVWISDIFTIDDALEMISSLGNIFQKEKEAENLVKNIQESFYGFQKFSGEKVAYFIWQNPLMVAGKNTFINHIIEEIGFENVFANQERYPEVSIEQLKSTELDYVFLSSEPFPFQEKHLDFFKKNCPQAKKVLLVDGEMFSWYGSRLQKTINYIKKLKSLILESYL